ncbi:lysozyme-like protein [Trametopsis cervina]|nr:lysozyme-like protein [Trametopsis cervina]
MKVTIALTWLVVAAGLVEASSIHAHRGVSAHSRRARQQREHIEPQLKRRDPSKKRCKPKAATSAPSVIPTTSKPPVSTPATQKLATQPSKAPAPPPKQPSAPKPPSGGNNLIQVVSSRCGPSGATEQITATSGPNGSEDWLNFGVETAAGWNPPELKITDIVAKDLGDVLKQPNNVFTNCAPYVDDFYQVGAQTGLPPILLASIAMQESSCNAGETGGAGEQGLMQITKDKCGGAPGGNCKDPGFNIRTGATFFKNLLDSEGGNLLRTLGGYNGWNPKMTVKSANAAGGCRVNNLDYLHQTLNGWVQGRAPTSNPRLGKYFNYEQHCPQAA